MGGRVSEWEARAMRKHDQEQAKIAREQGLPVRARIQDEARSFRKRRSAEIRASEQSRQWDRQREDIHTAEVAERLASVETKKPKVTTLPKAVHDRASNSELCIRAEVHIPLVIETIDRVDEPKCSRLHQITERDIGRQPVVDAPRDVLHFGEVTQ